MKFKKIFLPVARMGRSALVGAGGTFEIKNKNITSDFDLSVFNFINRQ